MEDAYKLGNLQEFERYSGELWTRDRLIVFVLRHARKSIPSYYDGAGARGPSMTDLKDVFAKSARSVHARAFETAEIIGVSHSFDRFIRTIYENSDRADGNLWTTGADGRYERLMSSFIDSVPRRQLISDAPGQAGDALGLERQFQFRFRARRTLYDCVSAHYPEFVGTRPGATTVAASYAPRGLPGATAVSTRGASIVETAPRPAAAEEAARASVAPPTATGVDAAASEHAWKRLEARVAQACGGRMPSLVKMAIGGEIRPQPARFDNYQEGGSGQRGRELIPARLPGVQ